MKTNGKKYQRDKPSLEDIVTNLNIHKMDLVRSFNFAGNNDQGHIILKNHFTGLVITINYHSIEFVYDRNFTYTVNKDVFPKEYTISMTHSEVIQALVFKVEEFVGYGFDQLVSDADKFF